MVLEREDHQWGQGEKNVVIQGERRGRDEECAWYQGERVSSLGEVLVSQRG